MTSITNDFSITTDDEQKTQVFPKAKNDHHTTTTTFPIPAEIATGRRKVPNFQPHWDLETGYP